MRELFARAFVHCGQMGDQTAVDVGRVLPAELDPAVLRVDDVSRR
jgi:hypothetical protein